MKFFCLNLRGVTRPDRGLDFYSQNESLAREAAEAMPEPGHPFWIRDFRGWEANWATHLGTTGVFIDGLDVFRSDVAIWRSIMDGSGFRRMTTKDMRVNDIHNPLSSGYVPSRDEDSDAGRLPGRVQLPGRHAADDRHHQRRPRRQPGLRQGLHGRHERRAARHGQRPALARPAGASPNGRSPSMPRGKPFEISARPRT